MLDINNRKMKTLKFIIILTAILLAYCGQKQLKDNISQDSKNQISAEITRQNADRILSEIDSGMSIEDVRKILPPGTKIEQTPIIEHGGIWMECLLGNAFRIQFRVTKPIDNKNTNNCKINSSSISLRDGKTDELIKEKGSKEK